MPVFQKRGRFRSRQHRMVLFIHIPKTGGSSIEDAFSASGWRVDLLEREIGGMSPNSYLRCPPQHMHWQLLNGILDMTVFDVIFTVVRQPLDRLLSEYRWQRQRRGLTVDLDGWVNTTLDAYDDDPFVHENHIRPQHEFLPPNGRVYRLEDGLEEALDDLSARLGVRLKRPPHAEKTQPASSPTSLDLSDATLERVRRFYAEDEVRLSYPPVIGQAPSAKLYEQP